jgi:hypothetical protein
MFENLNTCAVAGTMRCSLQRRHPEQEAALHNLCRGHPNDLNHCRVRERCATLSIFYRTKTCGTSSAIVPSLGACHAYATPAGRGDLCDVVGNRRLDSYRIHSALINHRFGIALLRRGKRLRTGPIGGRFRRHKAQSVSRKWKIAAS